MDNLGTEVSAKIRSAIKAKLVELDAYVDDELPDYIMVMVANDRTKEQMEEDLGLFLNENTLAFTSWLHNVLEKLRKVTLDEVAKKDSSDKKKKKSKKEPKKKEKDKDSKKEKEKPKTLKKSDSKSKKVSSKPEVKNPNKEELGERTEKKTSSKPEVSATEYDAEAILKKAVKSSAKALKVSSPVPSKKSSATAATVKKTSTGTSSKSAASSTAKKKPEKLEKRPKDDEDEEEKKRRKKVKVKSRKDRSSSSSESSSRSRERHSGKKVASQVQVVKSKKTSRHHRHRSRSYSSDDYDRRSVASKATVPPRPSRPSGREDRGVARLLGRSMQDADRSIMRSRHRRELSPPLAYPRSRSPPRHYSRSPDRGRAFGRNQYRGGGGFSPPGFSRAREEMRMRQEIKERERDSRREASPDDIERYRFIKEQHERMEEERRKHALKIEAKRHRHHDKEEKRSSKLELLTVGRQLAMDQEMEKRGTRAGSLDRELKQKKEERKRKMKEQQQEEDEEEEIRIIVRRDKSEDKESSEEEPREPTPPKKKKTVKADPEVLRLEKEDPELLEMRRKALESLMKKTVRNSSNSSRQEDRKIIIPLNEASTSEDGSSESESEAGSASEVSLSDVEELQSKKRPLEQQQHKTRELSPEADQSRPEPTFIVTMEGIDEKYFSRQEEKNALLTQRAKAAPLPASTKTTTEPRKTDQKSASDSNSIAAHLKRQEIVMQELQRLKSSESVSMANGRKTAATTPAAGSPDDPEALELHPSEDFDDLSNDSPRQQQEHRAKTVVAPTTAKKVAPSVDTKLVPVRKQITAPLEPAVQVKAAAAPAKIAAAPAKTAVSPAKAAAALARSTSATARPIQVAAMPAVPANKPAATPAKLVSNYDKPATVPSKLTADPAKPADAPSVAACKREDESEDAAKPKRKFTPISAPAPDTPPQIQAVVKKTQPVTFISTQTAAPKGKFDSMCTYYPNCKYGNACLYRHPSEAELLLAKTSKYKWSAR